MQGNQLLCPVQNISVRKYRWTPGVAGDFTLSGNEIHIWTQDLFYPADEVGFFQGLLSLDELERAGRYHFEAHRSEYIVSRGTLRALLGSYLRVSPRDLRFVYSAYGQPSLSAAESSELLNFNVSHSSGVALFAVAHARRIGIDVERVRRDFDTSEIAERYFSNAERAALRQLPQDDRHNAFFRCWTRKEAFIKALGEGLSHPLDQFDVTLTPQDPAALLATRPDASEAKRWMLWNICLPGDYAAALAAEIDCTLA